MKNKLNLLFILGSVLLLASSFILFKKEKPTLYIIGDSTVKNGGGTGNDGLWGWGSFMDQHIDTNKMSVRNHAIGGRSSRTFITDGRWDKILEIIKPGDYVIMQFGHNDGGALDDTSRARGTIRGIGEESKDIYNPIRKQNETVHTYGWYMRKYVEDAKARHAIPIVCSPIPRNDWKDGKVVRSGDSYTLWAKQVAEQTGAYFIDLNSLIAEEYEKLGQEKVKTFFPGDHTHPNKEGSLINARIVAEQMSKIKKVKKYIIK